MYHKSSKRRQIVMRGLVYAFMTFSVIAIVAVLMLVILGYSFNRQDGRLEQGGLLQFASTPSGATVTIDGLQTSSRTPSKASVEAKSHFVTMNLKGYREWQKTIAVDAGGIGWLSYTRFVPNDIKTDQIRTFPQLAGSMASTDRKWIIAHEDAASNSFDLVNLESDIPKFTKLAVPETVITPAETTQPQVYSLVEWSNNDDRILVKRTYDTSKTEWFVLDRQNPQNSTNITTAYAVNASDVKFGEDNGSDAYLMTDGGIVRRLDLDGKTLSGPLAENVAEYSVFDTKTLLYVTNPDAKASNQRHVGYKTNDMDAGQTIFSYPEATANVHVAFGQYYGKKYVGVTYDQAMKVFVGTLPTVNKKSNLRELANVTLKSAPTRFTIGENGRLAVAETADGFTTYDIELSKADTTAFTKPATVTRELQWIDSYQIASDRGNVLRLYEFDGGNQQDIMPVMEGQAVSLTGNEKFLYGFVQTQDGVALTRARMVINN